MDKILTNFYQDVDKVKKVIESCLTDEQCDVAYKMFWTLKAKYKDYNLPSKATHEYARLTHNYFFKLFDIDCAGGRLTNERIDYVD
jgi:hypothetical protein